MVNRLERVTTLVISNLRHRTKRFGYEPILTKDEEPDTIEIQC